MTGYGLYPGNGMHDVFHMDDLTNDAQHHALAYWLHVARRDRGLPVAAFTALNLPGVAADSYVLFELFDERIRDAVIRDVAPGVAKALGIHPVGLRLSQVMPPSYVADVVPAYALCAGLFLPLSSLDQVTYSDGTMLLVRRLVLPLSRRPPGASHAARHLLMIYDSTARPADEPARAGACRSMVAIRSLGIALYKDR